MRWCAVTFKPQLSCHLKFVLEVQKQGHMEVGNSHVNRPTILCTVPRESRDATLTHAILLICLGFFKYPIDN